MTDMNERFVAVVFFKTKLILIIEQTVIIQVNQYLVDQIAV